MDILQMKQRTLFHRFATMLLDVRFTVEYLCAAGLLVQFVKVLLIHELSIIIFNYKKHNILLKKQKNKLYRTVVVFRHIS